MTKKLAMTKSRTPDTIKSLHSQCIEEGECWVWQGYRQEGSPYVFRNNKMTAVRRIVMGLTDRPTRIGAKYFAAGCGNNACICPDHIVTRTSKEHMTKMNRKIQYQAPTRIAKLQASGRARTIAKLDEEKAGSIYADQRSHREIADEHGISKSLVSNIKRGVSWRPVSAQTNPWIGLMT